MKQLEDRKKRELNFNIGNFILVKLQPYRQTSITGQPFSRLNHCYYVPYKILAKIGKVVYKIELLEEDRIHTVFHVSHLKPFHEDSTIHSTALPTQFNEGQPLIRPFHILNTRVVLQDDKHITHVLVQWEGLLSEDASWVSLQDLQKSYPDFDL